MTPIELKANGRLVGVTLSNVGNVSLSRGVPVLDFLAKGVKCCGHPDRVDQEIVEADLRDLARAFQTVFDRDQCDRIQKMHRRMSAAMGRGSWPVGCHPKLYPHGDHHAALVYIDFDSFMRNKSINREVTDEEWQTVVVDAKVWPSVNRPVSSVAECKRTFVYGGPLVASHDRPEWRDRSNRRDGDVYTLFDLSTWLVLEAIRRTGCCYFETFDENVPHNVHELMKSIPGAVAGYAYFNNGTCGDHVTSNIDLTITYSLGWLCGLRLHEYGHTKNLQHEFSGNQSRHRSVMSYSQDNTPFFGYRLAVDPYYVNTSGNYVEDYSWQELRSMFGNDQAPPVVVPGDPGPGDEIVVPGELVGRLDRDVYIVDGVVGPIPEEAVGGYFVAKHLGGGRHMLVPKAVV